MKYLFGFGSYYRAMTALLLLQFTTGTGFAMGLDSEWEEAEAGDRNGQEYPDSDEEMDPGTQDLKTRVQTKQAKPSNNTKKKSKSKSQNGRKRRPSEKEPTFETFPVSEIPDELAVRFLKVVPNSNNQNNTVDSTIRMSEYQRKYLVPVDRRTVDVGSEETKQANLNEKEDKVVISSNKNGHKVILEVQDTQGELLTSILFLPYSNSDSLLNLDRRMQKSRAKLPQLAGSLYYSTDDLDSFIYRTNRENIFVRITHLSTPESSGKSRFRWMFIPDKQLGNALCGIVVLKGAEIQAELINTDSSSVAPARLSYKSVSSGELKQYPELLADTNGSSGSQSNGKAGSEGKGDKPSPGKNPLLQKPKRKTTELDNSPAPNKSRKRDRNRTVREGDSIASSDDSQTSPAPEAKADPGEAESDSEMESDSLSHPSNSNGYTYSNSSGYSPSYSYSGSNSNSNSHSSSQSPKSGKKAPRPFANLLAALFPDSKPDNYASDNENVTAPDSNRDSLVLAPSRTSTHSHFLAPSPSAHSHSLAPRLHRGNGFFLPLSARGLDESAGSDTFSGFDVDAAVRRSREDLSSVREGLLKGGYDLNHPNKFLQFAKDLKMDPSVARDNVVSILAKVLGPEHPNSGRGSPFSNQTHLGFANPMGTERSGQEAKEKLRTALLQGELGLCFEDRQGIADPTKNSILAYGESLGLSSTETLLEIRAVLKLLSGPSPASSKSRSKKGKHAQPSNSASNYDSDNDSKGERTKKEISNLALDVASDLDHLARVMSVVKGYDFRSKSPGNASPTFYKH